MTMLKSLSKLNFELPVAEIFETCKAQILTRDRFLYILEHSSLKLRHIQEIEKLPALLGLKYMYKLTKKNLRPDELATLQILACFLYLLPTDDVLLQSERKKLMKKVFLTYNSLEPMMVHYYTENLLDHIKLSSRSGLQYIFHIARTLSKKSAFANSVAICLFWNIIFHCGEHCILINQFRELGELRSVLRSVPLDTIGKDAFCMLLHSIGCLLHLTLCNVWLTEFQNSGYPFFYFRLLPQDGHNLQAWIKHSLQLFKLKKYKIPHRVQDKVDKILVSLDYLKKNSTEYCVVCRPKIRKRRTQICVLGQIYNRKNCTKV